MSGFLKLDQSMAWATDHELPNLVNKAFDAVITNQDDSPFIVTVYRTLLDSLSPQRRLNILYQLEPRLLEYYKSRYVEGDDLMQYRSELTALKHYLDQLSLVVRESKILKSMYDNRVKYDPARLDCYVYYHSILPQSSSHDEFLAFSQTLYHYKHINTSVHQDTITIPIYVFLFYNRIVMSNAISFCESLLEAESFRTKTVKADAAVLPATVRAFPVDLRNACFNEYIRIKGMEQQKILAENNERDDEVSLFEGELELLKIEAQNYKDALDRKIDPETLKMARFFIRRLRTSLGFDNPEEDEIDPSSEELNIPNENNDIDRRLRVVNKAKGLIRYKSDWGAIFKLHVEEGLCGNTDYAAFAERVNYACTGGKKVVTTADAIRQSPALYIIRGKWTSEGWRDGVNSRKSAGLLLRYVKIAQAYTQRQ